MRSLHSLCDIQVFKQNVERTSTETNIVLHFFYKKRNSVQLTFFYIELNVVLRKDIDLVQRVYSKIKIPKVHWITGPGRN